VVTTGSNIFIGNQTVTGSLSISGSSSLIGNQTLVGTKTITGSVFISGSKTIIGNNTVTGSWLVSGSTTLTGDTIITGSLNVSQGITGSLLGTASFATTSSYISPTFISSSAAASGFGSGGVTSITAGTGISINQTTGNVTITNTGGAGGISQGKVVAIVTGLSNLF
jgi:hypothetical protein